MKQKRKLTTNQELDKERLKKEFMSVFMNGSQVHVKGPQMIDGIPVDEFIKNNADPIWLHQNEMWELIEEVESEQVDFCSQGDAAGDPCFQNPAIKSNKMKSDK